MSEVSLRTAAMGYMFALRRFDDAAGRAITSPLLRDDLFIPLLETLTWLDMLFDRDEVASRVDPELRSAFKFARGRSHHAWAEAIEFRDDIALPPPPTVVLARGQASRTTPVLISDWCWRQPEDLPGGKRPHHKNGKAEYRRMLAGRQARGTLDLMTQVVGSAEVMGSSA